MTQHMSAYAYDGAEIEEDDPTSDADSKLHTDIEEASSQSENLLPAGAREQDSSAGPKTIGSRFVSLMTWALPLLPSSRKLQPSQSPLRHCGNKPQRDVPPLSRASQQKRKTTCLSRACSLNVTGDPEYFRGEALVLRSVLGIIVVCFTVSALAFVLFASNYELGSTQTSYTLQHKTIPDTASRNVNHSGMNESTSMQLLAALEDQQKLAAWEKGAALYINHVQAPFPDSGIQNRTKEP